MIAIEPTYAIALDNDARCAFELGDATKGRRYAKEALRFGEPGTYHVWHSGKYSKTK